MADEPESIILHHLRRLDAKLDRVLETQAEHSARLTALGEEMAGLHQDNAILHGRVDRLERRLDRIERRLDLVDA